jgi:catechol 2,3-dioxygenase-like lactoylglutathione lyase family enzyme
MKLQRIDHVGVVVCDLAAAKAFFLDLGLEVEGEGDVAGEWVARIIGLDGVKNTVVFLRVPGAEAGIELIQFSTPTDERGIQPSFANTLGIRHIAFAVEDVEAVVAKLKKNGTELVGEIQQFEDSYKLCYVRGPEGIIIELAQQIN